MKIIIKILTDFHLIRISVIVCSIIGIIYSIIGYNYLYESYSVVFDLAPHEAPLTKTPVWILGSFQLLVFLSVTFQIVFGVGMILRKRNAILGFCLNMWIQQAYFFGSAILCSLPKIGTHIAEVTAVAFAPFIVPSMSGYPIWSTILLFLIAKYDKRINLGSQPRVALT